MARAAAVTLILVGAFVAGVQPLTRPDPLPADAPADAFSADRAMAQVAAIAREPHPAGSAAMAKVADYLTAQLDRAGVDSKKQVVKDRHTGVTLRNTIGRIPGRDPTGAVLMVSHPDSVPFGPGAGDNATGVAVLLEVARALAAGPRLRNDTLVLFDDGEELGFRGGYAFARRNPLMRRVRLVVGVDTAAWGVAHVLQTSDENGTLVREYAAGVDEPVAFGLRSALEDGNFETAPFRDRGLPAIEVEDTYADNDQHTAGDTVDGVSPASIQQMGDQVLGMASAYGNADLRDASAPDRAFHTFPIIGVIHYPAAWSLALSVIAAAALVAVAAIAVRGRGARGRGLAAGFGLALVLMIGVAVLTAIAAALYGAWYPNPSPHPVDEYLLPSSGPFAIVTAIIVAALFGAAYRWLARRFGPIELALGFLGVWLAFAILFSVLDHFPGAEPRALALPVGSYAFQWPLLIACTAWLWVLHRPEDDFVLVVPAALAVFLIAPVLLLGYFGAGVADLPALALGPTLAAGLIAPVLMTRAHGPGEAVDDAA